MLKRLQKLLKNRKNKPILALLFILFYPINILASELSIAVASNLEPFFGEIIEDFQQKTKIKLIPSYGSSGRLASQISLGAPYTVFLSADIQTPQILFERGQYPLKPEIYTKGSLAFLCSSNFLKTKNIEFIQRENKNILDKNSLKNLLLKIEKGEGKIAIANPKIAPYGKKAQDLLNHLELLDLLKAQLVFSENVAGVNQYIKTQAADCGFVAVSTVFNRLSSDEQLFYLDESLQQMVSIEQGVLLLKKTADAKLFYDYILSPEVAEKFTTNGYRKP